MKVPLLASLVLLAVFTAIHTINIQGIWGAALFFIPGLVGTGIICTSGFSAEQCFLTLRLPSREGLLALALITPLLFPVVLSGEYSGWNTVSVLIYAPASGFAQELFFRGVLLPSLMRRFVKRPIAAILIHSILFSLWHLPLVFLSDPAGIAPVLIVTFIGGVAWGWQVYRDGTILWSTLHHSAYLMVMALFSWG